MLQKGSNKESVNVPSFLIRHLGTSTMGLTFKFCGSLMSMTSEFCFLIALVINWEKIL